MSLSCMTFFFFFFNDTATTEIYTLSLHDALPIWISGQISLADGTVLGFGAPPARGISGLYDVNVSNDGRLRDRKSTRLNSSHANISYAVFCLKKKKK